MGKLSCIGLGAMGSEIAKTFIENGQQVTVWNRSAEKAENIVKLGGQKAQTAKQAIEASQVIMVCIHGYDKTRDLLDEPDIIPLLSGRTIVQMSTGTPVEARELQAWVNRQGGRYLDCAIMVYPPSIGTRKAQILISGPEDIYNTCSAFIKNLGGDIRYLGANIGAAAALDMAVVTRLATITIAIVYGIHICQSEDVPLQQFTAMYPDNDRSHHLARNIETGQFDQNIEATVATSIEVMSAIRNLANDHGLNTELPDMVLGLYHRAAAAGCAEMDNASVIKVFRESCCQE